MNSRSTLLIPMKNSEPKIAVHSTKPSSAPTEVAACSDTSTVSSDRSTATTTSPSSMLRRACSRTLKIRTISSTITSLEFVNFQSLRTFMPRARMRKTNRPLRRLPPTTKTVSCRLLKWRRTSSHSAIPKRSHQAHLSRNLLLLTLLSDQPKKAQYQMRSHTNLTLT